MTHISLVDIGKQGTTLTINVTNLSPLTTSQGTVLAVAINAEYFTLDTKIPVIGKIPGSDSKEEDQDKNKE